MNIRVIVLPLLQNTIHQDCQGRQVNLCINQYRNATSRGRSRSAVDTHEKDRIIGLMRRSSNGYIESDRTSVVRCFNGKGSVLECRKVVRIIMELVATDNIQTYCDNYLGLDCSGFVNSYFNSVYGLRERNISSYYDNGRGNQRIYFEGFRNDDVLIWCNENGTINRGGGNARHIAVIDSVREFSGNELRATVVESTGTVGLVHSTYTFFETRRPEVYRVHRPLKPTTNHHVKVVPVLNSGIANSCS